MRFTLRLSLILAMVVFAAPATAAPATPYFYDSTSFQVKPSGPIDLSGTGSWLIARLRWRSWGPRAAVASGLFSTNTCKPNCAAGHFASQKATVVFSGVARCQGKQVFTNVRVFPASEAVFTQSFRTLGYLQRC